MRLSPRCGGNRAVRQPMVTEDSGSCSSNLPVSPVAAKARPRSYSGRAALLRLHPNGNTHESANCSPSRQELQVVCRGSNTGHAGNRGSRALGLAGGGWASVHPPLLRACASGSAFRSLFFGRPTIAALVLTSGNRLPHPNSAPPSFLASSSVVTPAALKRMVALPLAHRWHGRVAVNVAHGQIQPNPALELTRYGRPAWPGRRYAVHFRQPGQAVLP